MPESNDDNKRSILFIEDEVELREEVQLEFETDTGVSIITSSSANDAIAKTRNQEFDCIIVDLKLERGKGEEVIKNIRHDTNNPNAKTPIILTTANLTKMVLNQVKDLVQNIYTKPYSPADLKMTVDGLTQIGLSKQESSILYAEDEQDLANEIIEEIEDSGVGVIHVLTADAAYLQTKRKKFDCIIVDINLAIGRGDEFIMRVRKDLFNPNKDTPVIVASSHIDKNLIENIQGSIQGGVVKPYSIADLFSKIKPYVPDID